MTSIAASIAPNSTIDAVVNFGGVKPWRGDMPAWEVGALGALATSYADVAGLYQFPRPHKITGPLDPAAPEMRRGLWVASLRIATLAKACRAARWAGKPGPSVHDTLLDFVYEVVPKDDPLGRYSSAEMPAPLLIAEASDVATVQAEADHQWTDADHAARLGQFDACIEALSRLPNISPNVEAALAERGYTAAEFVVAAMARWGLSVAKHYRAATGPHAEGFQNYGTQATQVFTAALRNIEDGVWHTLGARARYVAGAGGLELLSVN